MAAPDTVPASTSNIQSAARRLLRSANLVVLGVSLAAFGLICFHFIRILVAHGTPHVIDYTLFILVTASLVASVVPSINYRLFRNDLTTAFDTTQRDQVLNGETVMKKTQIDQTAAPHRVVRLIRSAERLSHQEEELFRRMSTQRLDHRTQKLMTEIRICTHRIQAQIMELQAASAEAPEPQDADEVPV